MIATALDRLLDLAVVPGFTSVGYRVRQRNWEEMDLVGAVADRTVMVTGATSGLGLAAAHGFARAGARLHIVARDPHRAEEARASIIERSGNENVHMHLADLSRPGQVRALADTFERHHGLLDILVNNAGVLHPERRAHPGGPGRALGFQARRPSGRRRFVGHRPPGCSVLAPCQTAAAPEKRLQRR